MINLNSAIRNLPVNSSIFVEGKGLVPVEFLTEVEAIGSIEGYLSREIYTSFDGGILSALQYGTDSVAAQEASDILLGTETRDAAEVCKEEGWVLAVTMEDVDIFEFCAEQDLNSIAELVGNGELEDVYINVDAGTFDYSISDFRELASDQGIDLSGDEALSYYVVSNDFKDKLEEAGKITGYLGTMAIFGRCIFGQAIATDTDIQDIVLKALAHQS